MEKKVIQIFYKKSFKNLYGESLYYSISILSYDCVLYYHLIINDYVNYYNFYSKISTPSYPLLPKHRSHQSELICSLCFSSSFPGFVFDLLTWTQVLDLEVLIKLISVGSGQKTTGTKTYRQ